MRARALGTAALALLVTLGMATSARATISSAQVIDGPESSIVDVGGVAMSEDGSGGIVYRKRTDGRTHIYVAQFFGNRWRPPQRVDMGHAFDSYWPAIGAGDGGRLVVTWVQEFGAGTDRLFSASLDPGATRFQAPLAVDLNVGEATSTYPSLAMNPGGNAYLAYRVPTDAGSNQTIIPGYLEMDARVARYNGSLWTVLGSPADRNQSVPVRAPTPENSPKVGIDVAGNGLVAFHEPDEGFVDRVWARRIFGTTYGIPLLVSPQQFGGAPLRGHADAFSLDVAGFGQGAVAFRQQPSQGSALAGPHVFVNTIPEAFSDNAGQFTGPQLADGTSGSEPPGAPGAPAVGVTPAGVFRVAYGIGASARVTTGAETGAHPPALIGDGRGAVDTAPAIDVARSEATVTAWRARSTVVAVQELRDDGSFTVKGVSERSGGTVNDLRLSGSGLGDGLIGFRQGDAVSGAVVDAPPLDFAVQVPLKFTRVRRLRLAWDLAPNALSPVRYLVKVAGRTVARNVSGTAVRVPTKKLRDGLRKVTVTAIDAAGQRRAGTSAMLRLDRKKPRVRIRRRGMTVSVRVVDGKKGRAAGVQASSVRISFGDGKRGRKARVRHRYKRSGRYRVVVKARDRAGNRVSERRRVRVR
jgi:PKD domain